LPKWPGFKAGALNFALTQTAKDAAVIGVIDSELRKSIEALMEMKIPTMKMPEDVEISKELMDFEMPQVVMKNSLIEVTRPEDGGGAYHDKIDKNKKVNIKVRHKDVMMKKYGKAKTRGQKK
jgi:ATP-dependent RNA helicase RhlE